MKEKVKHYWSKKRVRYPIILALIVGVFFLVSSVVAITMFAVLPPKAIYLLDDMPKPTSNDRILVLSPHPDDETIAVGGYDHLAVLAGAEVKIALVTDGNKHGLKDTRYAEFKKAAETVGIKEQNLEFWNFLDGEKNDSQLDAISKMIVSTIKIYNPTIIIAPMTQDAHYDHYLAGKAYLMARAEANYKGQQYGYLVHHRYFPQPKELQPTGYLSPPLKYLSYGQGWVKIILPAESEDIKNEALLNYHSQLRVPILNSLLKSMIRQNELFVRLD